MFLTYALFFFVIIIEIFFVCKLSTSVAQYILASTCTGAGAGACAEAEADVDTITNANTNTNINRAPSLLRVGRYAWMYNAKRTSLANFSDCKIIYYRITL